MRWMALAPEEIARMEMSATRIDGQGEARAVLDESLVDAGAPHGIDEFGLPQAQGLYDPALDKDSCGVGFIADIKGRKSHLIVEDGLRILCNLEHRGATGADPRMGDGAGILVQI